MSADYLMRYFYVFIFFIVSIATLNGQRCELYPVRPLGMTDKWNGIKDSQITASSQFSVDTAPKYARLHYSDAFLWDWSLGGAGAWVSATQDYRQYLQVDFIYRKVVQSIATQGRQGSQEFIRDYYVMYTDNPTTQNWMYYRDEYGSPYLFEGNTNDTEVKLNVLKHPIIARYIRIYPQRWNRLIALRVEFYGCDYEVYTAYFNGKTRIDFRLDLPGRAVQSYEEDIRFRFRTQRSYGLLLYGDDGQGDYIVIELINGRIRIGLNLGDIDPKMANVMYAGSLLDDDQWHDVLIQRHYKMINVTVDRMEMWQDVKGEFLQLNLNRNLSLGGVNQYSGKLGITVTSNFDGCIENFNFNGLNMIRDARNMTLLGPEVSRVSGYVVTGVLAECAMTPSPPLGLLTFETDISWIRMDKAAATSGVFTASFRFRTFQTGGTFLFHQLDSNDLEQHFWIGMAIGSGNITLVLSYLDKAKNLYPLKHVYTNQNPRAMQPPTFADGEWHSVYFTISTTSIDMLIDNIKYITKQRMEIPWKDSTHIGGYWAKYPFFIGCFSNININRVPLEFKKLTDTDMEGRIKEDSCVIRDYCMPNPCKRDAKCTPSAKSFSCDCTGTGYTGAVCYMSTYPTSCDEVKLLLRPNEQKLEEKNVTIDLDGSGVLPPFEVTCNFNKEGHVWTYVNHNAMTVRRVDGFQQAGSFQFTLDYGVSIDALTELVRRSKYCQQEIYYRCKGARLLARPEAGGTTDENRAWGWWIGRRGQPRFYWGDSAPGHKKCGCGVLGNCQGSATTCNCDTSGAETEDKGLLTFKRDLPVTGIRLGDTGSLYDNRYSDFKVGRLECYGDTFFDNTVTFRKQDAIITMPAVWSHTEFDIMFLFKTTQSEGVFFQILGSTGHSAEVRLRQSRVIRFIYNVGFGIRVLDLVTTNFLNDNMWHVVRIERNRREATVAVDHLSPVHLIEPIDQAFRVFQFDKEINIGSTLDYTDGYLGCLSNFMYNGVILDLRGQVERGVFTYGLDAGCVPRCLSQPCFNKGECIEYYSHYWCECGLTSFRGYACGREVGVSMIDGPYLRITMDTTGLENLGTLDEYIQVGFKTKRKSGILMLITSEDYKEFIKVFINTRGGISVHLDVGFAFRELQLKLDVDLCNDQHHTVWVWRSQEGKVVYIKVDEYETTMYDFSDLLNRDSDTRLDKPKYIFIGRNGSHTAPAESFDGCLYRMQFNNYFPLKMVFQDPPNHQVFMFPNNSITEDRCGIEEQMPFPERIEIRPFPTIPGDRIILRKDIDDSMSPTVIAAIILAVFFFLLILAVFCFYRNFTFKKGDYETYEAKGAEMVDHPDVAIRFGRTGQPEVSGQEWWL